MAEYDCPSGEFDYNYFLADTRRAMNELSIVETTDVGSKLILTSYDAMRSHLHKQNSEHPVHVLSLLDFSFDLHKDITHRIFMIEDAEDEDIKTLFDPSIEFINKGLAIPNTTVIVHCYAGISRSSSVVLAYLMKEKNMTLDDAFAHLVTKRRIVEPNDGFWTQLEEFENEI